MKQTITVVVNYDPIKIGLHPPTEKPKAWLAYWAGCVYSRSTNQTDLRWSIAFVCRTTKGMAAWRNGPCRAPCATLQGKWKGLKQGFKLTHERTIRGQKPIETVYGVTSLSAKSATVTQLLEYVRAHWRIENSQPWL